jgi:putative inorganic carbon (HCO3(-)) transporter
MRSKPGATLEAVLDMMIEGILIALMVFTALTFGAVHTWAQSLMQAGLVVMGALWLCRVVWTRPSSRIARSFPGAEPELELLGYRFLRTGLGLPIAVFILLVSAQLIPLPPAAVRLVSPAAGGTFDRSLPGYAQGGPVDFTRIEDWLLGSAGPTPRGPGLVSRLLEVPGESTLPPSLTYSASRPVSLYPFATVGRLLMMLCLALAFLVITNGFRSRPQNERILWVVALTGFAMSVLGLAQLLQWNGRIYWFYPASDDASPFGPFFNHNHFAAYLEMAIPLTLGLFLQSIRRAPDALARLVLSGFSLVVMLSALLLSGSRGAILSLSAAVLVYGSVMLARRQAGPLEWTVGALALAAGLGVAASVGVQHLNETSRRLQSVAEFGSEPSLSARLIGWQYTLRILRDYPIIGSGLGTFPEAWIHYYPGGTASIWKEAHNDYLQVAAETGIAGTAVFAWGLFRFLKRYLFRMPRVAPGEWAGDVHVHHGIAIGLLSILLHSMVDFSLQVAAIALLFVVLSAIMVGSKARHAGA